MAPYRVEARLDTQRTIPNSLLGEILYCFWWIPIVRRLLGGRWQRYKGSLLSWYWHRKIEWTSRCWICELNRRSHPCVVDTRGVWTLRESPSTCPEPQTIREEWI